MTRRSISWTHQARDDIREIKRFIARWTGLNKACRLRSCSAFLGFFVEETFGNKHRGKVNLQSHVECVLTRTTTGRSNVAELQCPAVQCADICAHRVSDAKHPVAFAVFAAEDSQRLVVL